MTDDEIIAFCGLTCTECPAYIATLTNNRELMVKTARGWSTTDNKIDPNEIVCDGCLPTGERHNVFCRKCDVRICCQEKGLDNCSWCGEYVCDKLEGLWEIINSPDAKIKLDDLRSSR
jgi:hypothetical protein